jgi:prevent-host-death family protein
MRLTDSIAAPVSATEAKARFAEWLRRVEAGEEIVIARHGRPVAVLVPAADMERLRRLRRAGPEAGLVSLAGGWEGSEELAESLATVRRGPARRAPTLE